MISPVALALCSTLLQAAPGAATFPSAADIAEGVVMYQRFHAQCPAGLEPEGSVVEFPPPSQYDGHQGKYVRSPVPVGACRFHTRDLLVAIANGATWVQGGRVVDPREELPGVDLGDYRAANAVFKLLFGWHPTVEKRTATGEFNTYTTEEVQGLFDRLYLKPSAKVGGVPAQAVYDAVFRRYFRRVARGVAAVQASIPVAKRAELAAAYKAAAGVDAGRNFHGPDYLEQLASSLSVAGAPALDGLSLGVVLRRTMDGTLPVFDRLMARVATDYDPTLAREVAAALRP